MKPINQTVILWMLGMQMIVFSKADDKRSRNWGLAIISAAWIIHLILLFHGE